MIEATWELIIFIIGIALFFDFTNGFHDSANSISTVVSTKVLSPRNAVVFAAFFNFIAAFGFGVAGGKHDQQDHPTGIMSRPRVIPYIILGALIGAIVWNLITWFFGLPTSSSHALIGGMVRSGYFSGRTCRNKMVNRRTGRHIHDPLSPYRSCLRISVHGSCA